MNARSIRALVPLSLVLLAALLAGCGKSTPTSPSSDSATQQNADDAAQQVALTMSQGNGGMPPAAPSASRPAAGRAQASSADTTFTNGNLTWTLTRTWFDASDTEMPSYDPLTTVRVVATSRGTGTIATASDTASFGGAGTLDVHGIAAAQDTLLTVASRADTVLAAFTPLLRGGRTHVYSVGTAAWANVRQLKPVETNPWPLSGSATWTLHVDRLHSGNRGDVAGTFDATVIVTFNGTRYPDVTVSGGFHYTIDLATGAIARR